MDAAGIAISLLGLAAKVYPELSAWLRDLTDGKTDPLSVRVQSILPEESESARVLRELGG